MCALVLLIWEGKDYLPKFQGFSLGVVVEEDQVEFEGRYAKKPELRWQLEVKGE